MCQFREEVHRGTVAKEAAGGEALPSPSPILAPGPVAVVHKDDGTPSSTDTNAPEPQEPPLNLEHIELVHHFSTAVCSTLSPNPASQEIWRTATVKTAINHPFLMHLIFALSAMHICVVEPDRSPYFHRRATEYHTQAVAGCVPELAKINADNWDAVFIFTALNGFYVLADPTRSNVSTLDEYLSGYLHTVELLRSIRSLLQENAGDRMIHSRLWPIIVSGLETSKPLPFSTTSDKEMPHGIASLLSHLRTSDHLDSVSVKCYEHALRGLHPIFADYGNSEECSFRQLMAWPCAVLDPFIECLQRRRPEALVILSYYAILLHYYRHWWAIGDTGTHLVNAIYSSLGPEWQHWLEWPRLSVEQNLVLNGAGGAG